VVGAAQVVTGQRRSGPGRHAAAATGAGEHQRASRAAGGELPGDRLGDLRAVRYGGSIPLLQPLQQAAPNAEFILWGPEDHAFLLQHLAGA
jgi:hypothetical protein